MSVKYTRIPTSDPEAGMVFDYRSAFSYQEDPNWKYKSAFTYSKQGTEQASIVEFDTAHQNLIGRFGHLLMIVSCFLLYFITFPVSVWFSFKTVPNFERLLVFRLGRLRGSKGPGLVFILPCVDRWHKVDVRIKAFNVPPKQLLTADGAVIEVGADVYFRIVDVEKSVTNVQNLDQSTRILVQTCLLNLLVRRQLVDIQSQRASISESVMESCNKGSRAWGVEICRIEMSEIKVLKGPPIQSAPTVFFPPGMTTGGAFNPTAVPEAFQQLASAFLAAQGSRAAEPPQQQQRPELLLDALTSVSDEIPISAPTPGEILSAVQSVISESLVQKVAAVYQFHVSGDRGGIYYLDLTNGRGSAGQGVPPDGEPDATLMLSVEDLQGMFSGQLKPFQAYMNGRLRVSGDLAAAMRLEEVVMRVAEINK